MNQEVVNYFEQHERSMAEWLAFREMELTPEVIARMVVHSNPRARLDAMRSGRVAQAQIQILLNDEVPEVRAEAFLNFKQITPQHMAKALADESPKVRCAALCFDVTQAQAATAFQDPQTRYEAVKTGKLPQELLDIGMADDSPLVRDAAAQAGGKKNLRGTLKDIAYRVRCIVGF